MADNEDSGTDTVTAEAPEKEAPEAEVTPDAEATEEATPDYKALYEESEASRVKAEKDFSSLKGQSSKAVDNTELLHQIFDRIDGQERSTAAIGRATASGNIAGLAAELDTIATESASKRATSNFDAQFSELHKELTGAVLDEDGETLLNLNDSGELAEARMIWNEANDKSDVSGLRRAVTMTLQEARKAERKVAKAALKKEKEDKAKVRADTLQDADAYDQSSGKTAMTGNSIDFNDPASVTASMVEGLKERASANR